MLSEKAWKWEPVLLAAAGLLTSLFFGLLMGQLVTWQFPKLDKATNLFIRFLISTVSFQGVALLFVHQLLRFHEVSWTQLLGLDHPRWNRAATLGLAIGVIVIPVALLLNYGVYELFRVVLHSEPERQVVVTIVEQSAAWYQRVCFGFAAVVLAPVVEEILFRGILYPLLKQLAGGQVALWVSAFLFALIHANMLTFLPLLFLAIVLTLLYERTQTLVSAIAAHASFNAINFVLLLYAPQQQVLGWAAL